MLEPATGWAPTIVTSGFRAFSARETPMIVPVVPMADTKCVTRPSVAAQISGPVAASWARQLSGLANWSSMT
jgi:hypothetical protein